jgi:hypothetical protein
VTSPEFETAYLSYHLKNFGRNRQIDLPVILMERKVTWDLSLNEVVIRPTKIKMVQRGDTIVYDATAFNLPQGSMLDDLVRELPGAVLKPDGQIFVNGKKVDYLMLNSRDFFRGNNQVMLRNLPYYTVRDIKVYNRTTDLSAFLGREAENKEYVMDVQLKKAYRQGYLGNVEAGYGSHDRYKGRAFALRFTDNSRLTLYGGANNINDDNRPDHDGQWGSASDMNGEKKNNMVGGEFFLDNPTKKFRNTLQAILMSTRIDTETRTTSQSFLADGTTTFSRLQDISNTKETNLSMRDYWQVTKKWWLFGDVSFDHSSRHGHSQSGYASSNTDILLSDTLSSRSTQQYRDGHDNEVEVGLQALRKLAWGDEVEFKARYKHASAKHELFGKSLTQHHQQTLPSDYRHEYDKAKQIKNSYSLMAKYTVPFLKGPAVSLAYNPIYRRNTDHDNIFRLDQLKDWSASAEKPLRLLPSMADMMTSCIDLDNAYHYKDNATDHVLTLNISQHEYTAEGIQRNIEFDFPVTLTHERMAYQRSGIDTVGRRNYTVINPRFSYESIWKDNTHTFRASTSWLTSAADFLQLMPYQDSRNPLMIRESNPHLKHAWIYSVSASLALRLPSSSQMLSFSAASNIYGNQIANGFTYDPTTGVYTYRPENVNGNWDLRGDANYSISFGKDQCFNLENQASGSFLHSVDIASVDGSTEAQRSKVNTTIMDDRASFAFSHKALRVEALGGVKLRHTSSAYDGFESINAVNFNYGAKARYTIPFLQLVAETELTMYSRRGYGSSEYNTDDLIWNATLSRSFIKGRLVVLADATDLLGNRRSTQYAVNAQGRVITWQRTMPSYAMLRVQWRFNYNPKKK